MRVRDDKSERERGSERKIETERGGGGGGINRYIVRENVRVRDGKRENQIKREIERQRDK